MYQIESNSSQEQNRQRKSSFHSLKESQNEYDENFKDIIQVQPIQKQSEKSLRQTVKQTYKMCCSNIRTIKTNIAYNLKHSTFQALTKRQKVILNKFQSPIMLGKIYENNSSGKQNFYIDFNNVIWFSYRSGITGFQTDAGWGCMIRVCQMVLAETFKRISKNISLKQIIDYFKDGYSSYFSLSNICEKGNIVQRWTSSIQIFTILKILIAKFKQIPLNIDIHSACLQINCLKQIQQMEYPCLIFVSNRLGKVKLQQQYLDHILDVMKIQYFLGAIGGNGGQALYLVGSYSQKLIFLDPHYVQQNQNKVQESNVSSYFQSQPYCIDINCLAPSCAFTFLVKSALEYQSLLKKLYLLQEKHRPWICLQVHSDQIKKKIGNNLSKDTQQFEIL